MKKFYVNLFDISFKLLFPGEVEQADNLDDVDESEGRVPVEQGGGAGEAQGQDGHQEVTKRQSGVE